MNKCVFYVIGLIVIIGLASYIIYKATSCENYKKLKNIGGKNIGGKNIYQNSTLNKIIGNFKHKYDNHRYRHRRKYNHLGQQRRYE